MALSGVPLLFSGFWSKDEILLSAFRWNTSGPFYLAAIGVVLTAFYMTRQMLYVFSGDHRGQVADPAHPPHESPPVMTAPLAVLAVGTILLSIIGTPAWPWFHNYLSGHAEEVRTLGGDVFLVMLLSTALVAVGIGCAWWLYGRKPSVNADLPDALETLQPDVFTLLRRKFFVDEFYDNTVVRLNWILARTSHWLDVIIWGGIVSALSYLAIGLAWINRFFDEKVVNLGFDEGCGSLRWSARLLSFFQNGQVQRYLRVIGFALAVFAVIFIWGCRQ